MRILFLVDSSWLASEKKNNLKEWGEQSEEGTTEEGRSYDIKLNETI